MRDDRVRPRAAACVVIGLVLAALMSVLWAPLAGAGARAEASAAPLELTAGMGRASLEGRMEHFADASGAVTFDEARRHGFTLLPDARSLGYDTQTHWFRFALTRTPDAPSRWLLVIGDHALDDVDVWVGRPESGFRAYTLGNYRSVEEHPLPGSPFVVPVDIDGPMDVYLRVHSTNALVVHADMWRPGAFAGEEGRTMVYAGLHSGVLLIAAAFYGILGGWVRDRIMATYAGYVLSQALLIHGDLLGLFNSQAPWIDDVLSRLGWLGGSVFIVLMWDKLLDLKRTRPRIHSLYMFTILLDFALLPFAVMPSLVTAAILVIVKAANILNSLNFVISMAVVFADWRRTRRAELVLYFVAFFIPAFGILVNTAANQGVVPQNVLTANIYQVAPLVHVLVMSFGLALRLQKM